MDRHDEIKYAYKRLGSKAAFYDGICLLYLAGAGHSAAAFMRREKTALIDWPIEKLCMPKGFFVPPYERAESLRQ